MRELIRSEEWDRDVTDVLNYLDPLSHQAATRLVDQMEEWIERISANPKIGRAREEIRPGLRSVVVGDYLLFYRVTDPSIEILRFLHGSRDLRAALA